MVESGVVFSRSNRERERERGGGGKSASASVICTVSRNPDFNPTPLNRVTISPTRFVSPATNKQQNEHGPISRQQRLVLEAL